MTMRNNIGIAAATCLAVFAAGSIAAPRAPRIQTGPDAEVSFDGLHRVDRTVMDVAWAMPTLDLTEYSKLMLVRGGFAYREVDDPGRYDRSATEFPIEPENRARFEEEVGEVFREELAKIENWEYVTEPGPDVLVLVGYIIDVVSAVPPEPIGRNRIYLTRVGEATLVLELRDSMSNEILARSADRRGADPAWPIESSRVTNLAEVRRLARTWARILVKRLDQLAEL